MYVSYIYKQQIPFSFFFFSIDSFLSKCPRLREVIPILISKKETERKTISVSKHETEGEKDISILVLKVGLCFLLDTGWRFAL